MDADSFALDWAVSLDQYALVRGDMLAFAQSTQDHWIDVTTQANAWIVVTAPTITLDGKTEILVEFRADKVEGDAAVDLWEDSLNIGTLIHVNREAEKLHAGLIRVPTAGTHTFSARAYSPSGRMGNWPPNFRGTDGYQPIRLLVSKTVTPA